MSTVLRLASKQDGATAIEYALIATLISLAALLAYQLLGTNLSTIFNSVGTQV